MPPLLAVLPLIGEAVSMAVPAAVGGLQLADALGAGSAKAPATVYPNSIPGSPLDIVNTGGTPGAPATGAKSPVLGQILGGGGASQGPLGSILSGASSGGAGKAVAPPAAIGGGTTDFNNLPWYQNLTQGGGIAPGVPGGG